ncbi:hypothetical protein FQZ97_1113980 [compost metagenome]
MLGVGRHQAGWRLRPVSATAGKLAAGPEDHSQLFDTWSFSSERPLSLKALRAALAALPVEIYRAKGVCQIAEAPGKRCIVHVVGSRSEIKPEDGWEGGAPYTQLIFIGRRGSIDAAALQAMFEGCQV